MNDAGMPNGDPLVQTDWPLFGLVVDPRPVLAREKAEQRACVLATLYAASGGAPRGVGAQMVVTSSSASGYLSGGCVEADVVRNARTVLSDGVPRWLVYGKGGPIDIQLPCGGRIEILLERLLPHDEVVADLLAHTRARQPARWTSDGITRSCTPDNQLDPFVCGIQQIRIALSYEPRQRLAVVGHDPVALALASMAIQSGIEVHLIRPKGPTTPPPVDGIVYWRTTPAIAFAAIGLDPWTAVAVATHQDDDDHDALIAALPASAGYVGLLGSRRRLPGKRNRLLAAGLSPEALSRLKAPIGVSLDGNTPWDVAIGILAEARQVLNGSRYRRLRPIRAVNAA